MQRNSKLWMLTLVVAVAASFVACDRKTIYVHYEHTPITGWDKSDVLYYDVPAIKEEGDYKEDIGLRVVNTYPFQGLSLVIKQTILPSGYEHSDTVNYNLFDRRGNTKGPGVSFYQFQFHFNTLQLRKGDSLHISVKHNMKREIMPGITDVGIRIDRLAKD